MAEFGRPKASNPHNFTAEIADPRIGGKVSEQTVVDTGHGQAVSKGEKEKKEKKKPALCC